MCFFTIKSIFNKKINVMPEYKLGEFDLICKQDGVIVGLSVFERVFALLDSDTECTFYAKDGDEVKNGALTPHLYSISLKNLHAVEEN